MSLSPSASSDSLSSIGASTEPLPASEGPEEGDDPLTPQQFNDDEDDDIDEDEEARGEITPAAAGQVKKRRNTHGGDSDSSLTEQSSSDGAGTDDEDDDDGTPRARRQSNGHREDEDEDEDEDEEEPLSIKRGKSSSMNRLANFSRSSNGSGLSESADLQDLNPEFQVDDELLLEQGLQFETKPAFVGGRGRGRGGRGKRGGAVSKRGKPSGRGRGASSSSVLSRKGVSPSFDPPAAEETESNGGSRDVSANATPKLEDTETDGEVESQGAVEVISNARASTTPGPLGGRGGKRGRGRGRGASSATSRGKKRSSEQADLQPEVLPIEVESPGASSSRSSSTTNKKSRVSYEGEPEDSVDEDADVVETPNPIDGDEQATPDDAQAAEVLGELLTGGALPPIPGAEVHSEEEAEVDEDEEDDEDEDEDEPMEGDDPADTEVVDPTGDEALDVEEEADLEVDTPNPNGDPEAMAVDGDNDEEEEEEEQEETGDVKEGEENGEAEEAEETGISKKKGAGGRKPGKRGRKAAKAKATAEDDEEEGSQTGSQAASDQEDDQASDDAFMRKRAEAMGALTKIEVNFARLRDRLYVERMAEVECDRTAVETGTHPELIHLTKLIELRRARKLELAKNQFDSVQLAYAKQREMAEHKAWVWWADARADLRITMLDEANSKRRRLEREKRNMDRPQDSTLLNALAPKPTPIVPLQHRRRLGFEGEALTENDIAWALRHRDVQSDPSVSGLEDDMALADLERMGLRQPSAQSAIYGYDSMYGPGPVQGYGDGPMIPSYGYQGFDPMHSGQTAHLYGPTIATQLPPLPPPISMGYPAPSIAPLPIAAPRRELGVSRPASNPRIDAIAQQMGGHEVGRTSSYPGFGASAPYADVEHAAQANWSSAPKSANPQYKFDDSRRRTPSMTGTSSLSESLEAVAGDRERNRRSYDEIKSSSPNSHSAPSSIAPGSSNGISLDAHMKHVRSPKTSSGFASHSSKMMNGGSSDTSLSTHGTPNNKRPAFMSIPAIPPYNPHRHAAAVAAQAAASTPSSASSTPAAASPARSGPSTTNTTVDPAPPTLPPLIK